MPVGWDTHIPEFTCGLGHSAEFTCGLGHSDASGLGHSNTRVYLLIWTLTHLNLLVGWDTDYTHLRFRHPNACGLGHSDT